MKESTSLFVWFPFCLIFSKSNEKGMRRPRLIHSSGCWKNGANGQNVVWLTRGAALSVATNHHPRKHLVRNPIVELFLSPPTNVAAMVSDGSPRGTLLLMGLGLWLRTRRVRAVWLVPGLTVELGLGGGSNQTTSPIGPQQG